MKKFLLLFILIAAVMGCDKDTPPVAEDVLTTSLGESPVITVGNGVDSKNFTIETNTSWTISNTATDWVTVTPNSGDAGEFTIVVKTKENTTGSAREATLTITAGTAKQPPITVKQAQNNVLGLDKTELDFKAEGEMLSVNLSKNVEYTVSIPTDAQSWLSSPSTKAVTIDKLDFTATTNTTGAPQKTTVTITAGTLTQTIAVTQEQNDVLTLLPTTLEFVGLGKTLTTDVTSNVDYTVTIPAADTWLTNVTLSSATTTGLATKTLSFTAKKNESGVERTTTVIFKDKNSTLEQPLEITQPSIVPAVSGVNSYMVAPGATVIIPIDLDERTWTGFTAPTMPDFTTALTTEILWAEDITTASVTPTLNKADKTITIVTSGTANGNAVVALKDAGGAILWSWHVWVTDYDVSAVGKETRTADQTYAAVKGNVHTYKEEFFTANGADKVIMDRNLGATASVATDVTFPTSITSSGLYYQWGRKDPFKANTNPVTSVVGSVAYSVKNPDKFMISENDWCTTQNDNLWSGASTDKSPYDPCPEGWRVPKEGTWKELSADISKLYPISGFLVHNTGKLFQRDVYGYSWSSSSRDSKAFYLDINTSAIRPYYIVSRASGFPVRCVQE